VKCFSLADLFAGEMHAVLFRQWQQCVKGCDWFVLEWYMRRGIPLHLDHLAERTRQSGHWPRDEPFSCDTLQMLLAQRIETLDVAKAREDFERFIMDSKSLTIWSQSYFQQLGQRIQLVLFLDGWIVGFIPPSLQCRPEAFAWAHATARLGFDGKAVLEAVVASVVGLIALF
jgi:hypothetical protein